MSGVDQLVPRVEVIAGGAPTPAQAAALAVALLRVTARGPARPAPLDPAGWRVAALREGVDGVRIVDRGELRELDGPG